MGNDHELKLKFTADTAAAAKAIGALTNEHGELMRSARELAQQFPQVAAALRVLAGPAGVIFVGIEAFNRFKEAVDELNKASDEMAERAADPTFAAGIEAKKKAVEEAALGWQKFNYQMAVAVSNIDALKHALTSDIAAIKAASAASGSIADALFGFDEAKLKAEYDHGLILFEQYQQTLAQLENKHRHDAEARKEAEIQAEIDAKTSALERLNGNQDALQAKAKSTAVDESRAGGHLKKDDEDVAKLKDDLAKSEARLKELQAGRESLGHIFNDLLLNWFNPNRVISQENMTLNSESALNTQLRRAIAKLSGGIPAESEAAALATLNADTAKSDAKDAKAESTELRNSIDDLTAQLRTMHAAAGPAMSAEDMTSLLKTKSGAEAFPANAAADILAHGGKVSVAMQDLVVNLASTLAHQHLTLKQAVNLLKGHENDIGVIEREIQIIEAQHHANRPLIGNGN